MSKIVQHLETRKIVSVTIDELISQIEALRLELINIKVGRAYTDPDVVTASQKLDVVLNKYQEFMRLNKSNENF